LSTVLIRKRALGLTLIALCVFPFIHSIARADDQSPLFIHASGSRFVDAQGSQFILKGCNLGNDLMLESWMFGGTLGTGPNHAFRDGATVYRTLRDRFGEDRFEHLIDLFRTGWITPRDFQIIKSFGFNVVRLPFDYRLIQEDQPPFDTKPDAFQWLDHTVQMAHDAGVYVILDLHGTPGGQSLEDHTGLAGQDHLWTSAENQRQTVQVWKSLAEHFKNTSTVAAYDLINEPYGNHNEDCRPVLARLIPQIYDAIRSTGDQHIVFFPGALASGIVFYGNPHDRGMTNVAFTEHYYPGLFGSTAALETQARVLNQVWPVKRDYLDSIASPYFVGEFNVVLDSENPSRLMREYYDRLAQYGWAGTLWSYKLLSTRGGVRENTWCMVTNSAPLPSLDLNNSSYDDFEHFFTSMATMELSVNDRLRNALLTQDPEPLYLSSFPPLPRVPPTNPPPSDPPGYSSIDLGGALPGYTQVLPDGTVRIMAGGEDIHGPSDSCRFVSRPEPADSADVRATILSLVDSDEFAKAAVTARWGEADRADTPMAMVNVFPDGTLALMTRPRRGAPTIEQKIAAGVTLPVELRLQIATGHATAMYRVNTGDWQTIGSVVVPSRGQLHTGLAVCAHIDSALTTVKARLGPSADDALPAPTDAQDPTSTEPSLLLNGSFEQQGDAPDLAANWNRFGPWMNRETGWKPTHSGSCEIGYHHWQITSSEPSGLWQDVDVQPGKRFTFSIFAQRDIPSAGDSQARAVEMRVESVTDHGQITLNSRNFDVTRLATAGRWTRLSVTGTADTSRLRVLVIISPSIEEPRGGAIKLDDAALVLAKNEQ
jgi:endoglucanase